MRADQIAIKDLVETLENAGATLSVESGRLMIRGLNPLFGQRYASVLMESRDRLKEFIEERQRDGKN